MRQGFSVAAAAVVVACASQPTMHASDPAPLPATGVLRYMPLEPGHVWAYDTEVESTGAHGVAVMELVRRDAQVAVLSIAGKLQHYEAATDGIRHIDGGYLLREPLIAGASWKGRSGLVTVVRVDREVVVPAGSYRGCVETREEASQGLDSKRITTVFCPGAGIVEFEVSGGRGAEQDLVRYRLRSYGPKVVLELPVGPSR